MLLKMVYFSQLRLFYYFQVYFKGKLVCSFLNEVEPVGINSKQKNWMKSNSVSARTIGGFLSKNLVSQHISTLLGFVSGIYLFDFIFYDQVYYERIREEMEEEYWKKYGEPKEIEPYYVESLLNPGKMRKSWIHIMYEKDKRVPKKDDLI